MGYFPVRYDTRVVNYDRRGFIRLATDDSIFSKFFLENGPFSGLYFLYFRIFNTVDSKSNVQYNFLPMTGF